MEKSKKINSQIKRLQNFEKEIAKLYEKAKIRFPIHLSGGNERQLIKIFKKFDITKRDFIFSTWRSHYHWLLSNRSAKRLKQQILKHGSMHIYDKNFFTSAIVGGIAPIALGVALAYKLKNSKKRVFCFVGDMASKGGLFSECVRYAKGHDLPILYIIEDNELSVKTPTKEVWGRKNAKKTIKYKYKRQWPHSGIGKFVLF